jgi:uncharacterized YigZ family protein
MPPSRHPIPAGTARVETRVVNSRFIATVGQARTPEAAKAFVAEVRAEMPDATHHVFAFRVGYGSSITEGMSDDGEPPGTAGRPTLAVLRGADLGDVVLVVTRYFGGTKLGTGGLVRAYTQAAQEALAALPRAERVERRGGDVVLPYGLYERVRRLVAECGGEVSGEVFGAEVTLSVVFAVDEAAQFERSLQELSAGRIHVAWRAGQG